MFISKKFWHTLFYVYLIKSFDICTFYVYIIPIVGPKNLKHTPQQSKIAVDHIQSYHFFNRLGLYKGIKNVWDEIAWRYQEIYVR